MTSKRFDRQEKFFGKNGQARLHSLCVAVIGVGGVGSHVIQQLAYLGVGYICIIDPDELEETNLNRLIGARHDDPIPGTKKVDIAARLVNSINPSIKLTIIDQNVISKVSFDTLKKVDFVFGCVDNDGPRLVLTELCSAYEIPYIDLATEIISGEPLEYGGRIYCSFDENGCLMCMDEISEEEARMYFADLDTLKDQESIYGVSLNDLNSGGPSVISLNGIIASLGVMEFLVTMTGIRSPNRFLKYYGSIGMVTVNTDSPSPDCYYCKGIRGNKDKFNIDQYLK